MGVKQNKKLNFITPGLGAEESDTGVVGCGHEKGLVSSCYRAFTCFLMSLQRAYNYIKQGWLHLEPLTLSQFLDWKQQSL